MILPWRGFCPVSADEVAFGGGVPNRLMGDRGREGAFRRRSGSDGYPGRVLADRPRGPCSTEGGPQSSFRIEFAKPNNVACLERLNEERDIELIKNGNARPGRSVVLRSKDGPICAWS